MRSNAIALLIPIILISMMIGCGSSSGGGASVPATAPVIYDLNYAPASASYDEDDGDLDVNFSFKFIDEDRAVRTLRLTDSHGRDVTQDMANWGIPGLSSGTIYYFLGPVDTTKAGTFTFDVWVIDTAGNASNTLSGSFTVEPQSQISDPQPASDISPDPGAACDESTSGD